ncbi:DNA recombination protein RmuC [Helicobacter sp. MIT 14-3879]|uniref:DNA recombination protein RmuC n=1 Tax=Helicobacter sp. MIT 14-3879 TaxID=2040649 RepID=UPI000E1E4111|nr:DNA recombination protein RmuC [Helicobacter sp. MIT 14-3879]RDU64762.1 DNA recombination protein RmuC [Helicobacter sp. MIT 14-3879]
MIYILLFLIILTIMFSIYCIFLYIKQKKLLEKNKILDSTIKFNEVRINSLESSIDEINNENKKLIEERANLKTSLEYEKKINEDKLKDFQNLKEQSKNEFKILSQDILEEKINLHKQSQKENLDIILKPLQNQIDTFKKRIDEIHNDDIKERSTLISEIKHLKDLNIKISQDATNLTNALKGNNKTQGNWGEIILEKLLQDSGLIKDREYILQQTYKNEEGNYLRPDVIIQLPNNKKIIIDSKVSLINYERLLSKTTTNKDDLNIHIISLRNHIKELSKKNYENLLGGSSLDFVLMFIPIEGAFLDALRYDNELFLFAYNKNIILVSPTTLLATLRTINNIWQNERQNNNMQEILDTATSLYDKFRGFYENIEKIGDGIKRIDDIYHKSINQLKEGKGSIYSKIEKLEELGIKVKNKLPQK